MGRGRAPAQDRRPVHRRARAFRPDAGRTSCRRASEPHVRGYTRPKRRPRSSPDSRAAPEAEGGAAPGALTPPRAPRRTAPGPTSFPSLPAWHSHNDSPGEHSSGMRRAPRRPRRGSGLCGAPAEGAGSSAPARRRAQVMAAGRWPLAAGRWPLAAGRWPLAAGRWPLAAGRWPLAAGKLYAPELYAPEAGAGVKGRRTSRDRAPAAGGEDASTVNPESPSATADDSLFDTSSMTFSP